MAWTSRPYAGESDLPGLIAFITRARPPERLADYPSPLDLREILALAPNQARTRLWLDEQGNTAGYGLVDHYDNVLFDAAPGPDTCDLFARILDWAEEAIQSARAASGGISIDTNCRSEDAERIRSLLARGYSPTGISTVTLVRDLRGPLPDVPPPPGWTIRPVKGEVEAGALVAVHRAAFGTERLTIEERLSWMREPHYVPGFDLALERAEGGLAGYCMCGIEREANKITGQRRGYTDPVAVRPDCQGRGGARALISHGMRLLAKHGMTEAIMNTSSENARMLRVAASLGFEAEVRRAWYSKTLA